jgi:hypothetical protein
MALKKRKKRARSIIPKKSYGEMLKIDQKIYLEIVGTKTNGIHLCKIYDISEKFIYFKIFDEIKKIPKDILTCKIGKITFTIKPPSKEVEIKYYQTVLPLMLNKWKIKLPNNLKQLNKLYNVLKEIW